MKENLIFLILSVSLSVIRNVISKTTAIAANSRSQFFLSQTILFGVGTLLLFPFGIRNILWVSPLTICFGLIYGALLVLSQWMLTLALKKGNTSVCSVVYSLGFLLPTISGAIFWNETITLLNFVGIFVAVGVIMLTAQKSKSQNENQGRFTPFILIAMISSGGLGIMQKVQQSSDVAEEKTSFLLLAFLVAFCCSLIAYTFCREKSEVPLKFAIAPALIGICFGGANFFNTVLAGNMKSAIFFPLQNISTVVLSTLFGIIVFKEKFTIKTGMILLFGLIVILLFSV